jgi:sugar transferase (PEP-CTERM/EpsH1 system associated)
MTDTPLVVHVIHRLGMGGLENGLANLINRTPPGRYRHAVVCLKDSTDFRKRLPPEVPVYEMHRKDGQDFGLFVKVYRLLRELRPDVVHTRNLAALECQWPAWLARVPGRVHGEHGWDTYDPDGLKRKYQWLRRAFVPLIHRFIPLSRHLEDYLRLRAKVPEAKITRICNGVDTQRFHPPVVGREAVAGCPFSPAEDVAVIGTVGRMHGVKDQLNLVRAFLLLLERRPEFRAKARLALVGEGPLREEARALLSEGGALDLAWLPGERYDAPDILRGLDIFTLPSQAEGISNTVLEAMATGLPVVATAVGGNPELVLDGVTGRLVPSRDPQALAAVLAEYLDQPALARAHGAAGRARILESFSLDGMVERYLTVYDQVLGRSSAHHQAETGG